jgi:hypothetical protein
VEQTSSLLDHVLRGGFHLHSLPGASRRGMTTESREFLSYSQDKRSVHGQCCNGSPPDGCTSYEVDALPAKVFMPGMPSRVIQSDFAAAVWIDGALTGGLTQRT